MSLSPRLGLLAGTTAWQPGRQEMRCTSIRLKIHVNTLSIIVSSTRPNRIGHAVSHWVAESFGADWQVRIQDLAVIDLPFLDEEEMPATGRYAKPHTIAWARQIAESDAVLVMTPQYNRSFPAPIKNAVDYLFAEWHDKPVAVVGYGWSGALDAAADLAKVFAHLKADVVGTVGLVFNTDLSAAGEVSLSPEKESALRALSASLAHSVSGHDDATTEDVAA